MLGGTSQIYTTIDQSRRLALGEPIAAPVQPAGAWAQAAVTNQPMATPAGGVTARYCSGCGSPVAADSSFCASYGAKVIR